jgi:hypothetical protein
MSSTTTRRVRRKVEPAKPTISILDAMEDDQLFGTHFHDTESWEAWKAFLASLFGLPMDEDQLCIFRECTNRQQPPEGGTTEAHLVCGRRGGKSYILATIAVYLAAFMDWKQYLARGERGTIMLIAADRKQAREFV